MQVPKRVGRIEFRGGRIYFSTWGYLTKAL
jgi:hypothetical protein